MVDHLSNRMMLWDFLWVFWLLRLFRSIKVRSFLTLSHYLYLVLMWWSNPKLQLFFFFTVLFSFFEFCSSRIFSAFLLYYNCCFWRSLSYSIASRISFMHSVFASSLFIYRTNRAEIELSNCFSYGELSLGRVITLLLNVCLFLLLDFRLCVFSGRKSLDWSGELHTKLFHCIWVSNKLYRYLN